MAKKFFPFLSPPFRESTNIKAKRVFNLFFNLFTIIGLLSPLRKDTTSWLPKRTRKDTRNCIAFTIRGFLLFPISIWSTLRRVMPISSDILSWVHTAFYYQFLPTLTLEPPDIVTVKSGMTYHFLMCL